MRHSPRLIGFLLLSIAAAFAQRRRDPLNPLEIDKLRDAAQDADTRLKLYVDFAHDRLTALDKARTDPKATDRTAQIHDCLQDFADVYDELDDNIDNFVKREADLRKPLKHIIEADSEFQGKLRGLQEEVNAKPEDAKAYEFLLSTVLETLETSAKEHRDLLAEQEEAAKHKKQPSKSAPPAHEFR